MTQKAHELIPSARRLIASLRDIGYDFASAVADLVDNSIEASATRIQIEGRFDGDESWVRIVDNGVGMSRSAVREALRFGTERDYDPNVSLGKFGLGLKTASLSQCRRVTVASRSSKERADVHAHAWDLAHVESTNRWEIIEVPKGHDDGLLRYPLQQHTGTVVIWQQLDRILGFRNPYGGMARRRLASMCAELAEHLSMVFHQYLGGESLKRRVRITVNGRAVKPWDPFARDEPGTKLLPPCLIPFDHGDLHGEVLVRPYILPHQNDFSTPEAHLAAAGPQKWNRQQGFYIYRANRLIQSGGWCGLRTLDEHLKLARVAVFFDPQLDEAFKVNVAKMRVQLPLQLRTQFEELTAPILREAQAAYRKRSPAVTALGSTPAQIQSSSRQGCPTALDQGKSSSTEGAQQLWTIRDLRRAIEQVAMPAEREVLSSVFDRFLGQAT